MFHWEHDDEPPGSWGLFRSPGVQTNDLRQWTARPIPWSDQGETEGAEVLVCTSWMRSGTIC